MNTLTKTAKPTAKRLLSNALIDCLVIRERLAVTGLTGIDHAQLLRELEEAHLKIERLLFRSKRLHLDHLTGVDRIYGIKRRVMPHEAQRVAA